MIAEDDTCEHVPSTFGRDLVLICLTVLIFFVMREVLSWMLKTNHTKSLVERNQSILLQIQHALQNSGVV